MAMTECKECKQEISTKAKTCPNCGVKDPGTKASDVIVLAVIILGISMCSSDDEPSTSNTSAPAKTAPKKTPEQIAAEEAACKKDLSCWGEKHSISAAVYCDDYVENLAQYSHEWTDGMLEPKFSHYRWKNIDKGVVTYIGDKIKFQNGFGAWQNYVYECDFDPVTDTILDVRAQAGRL